MVQRRMHGNILLEANVRSGKTLENEEIVTYGQDKFRVTLVKG
jgi:hypothetical protein